MLVEPLTVGLFAGDLLLDLGVVDDAALRRVDVEHAAGLQAALLGDVLRGDVEHADLGGHDDLVVFGDVVAGGAKTIAVERRADAHAVGEGHAGGAVPRLHQAGVVLVERLLLVAHRLVIRPGLRDHHHHRVRQRAAGQDE